MFGTPHAWEQRFYARHAVWRGPQHPARVGATFRACSRWRGLPCRPEAPSVNFGGHFTFLQGDGSENERSSILSCRS